MTLRVFHINAEVRPVRADVLDPTKVSGAAVRCLVPACSEDEAVDKLRHSLDRDGMLLVMTEWVVDFDETQWDNDDTSFEQQLAEQARATLSVQLGTFHTWLDDSAE